MKQACGDLNGDPSLPINPGVDSFDYPCAPPLLKKVSCDYPSIPVPDQSDDTIPAEPLRALSAYPGLKACVSEASGDFTQRMSMQQSALHWGDPDASRKMHAFVATVEPMERPLRVIHVGQCLVRAGIERWLYGLLRFASPQHLKFLRCVVTSPLYDPQVLRELPVPVELGGRESVRRAAQDCDILLVSGPAEVGDWLANCRPPLCVGVAHGTAIWSRRVLEGCRPVLDHVVAVSQAVQDSVCEGFPSSVIYNGIDTTHLAPSVSRDELRARFGFTQEDFVLGSVMRLSVEKHPEVLVEAIARLPRRFKLLLVGWGTLRAKLLNLANDLAPLRCVITPADQHVGDYYRAFDAFCLPSLSEGFGLATLEAMFCGLPVVTTPTGFAPELLVEGVQYLACQSEATSIARVIKRLATYPEWAANLGREAQRRAERFGFATRMCREYESLLIRLWQTRSSHPSSL